MVAAIFDLRAIGVSGATLAVLRSSFLSAVALDVWLIDVSARTLKLLQFVWMASVFVRFVGEMAVTEQSAFSPWPMPPICCAAEQWLATVDVVTACPYCITLLRSFFMPTAGNVFSCDLKNPVIFVCEPKFGGLKMCCAVALAPPIAFGVIGVPPAITSMVALVVLSVPLEETCAVTVAIAPLAVLLFPPSHVEFFATLFDDKALLSQRLRFVAIEFDSVAVEVPRMRFGLIVLIDVNSDNNGAAVDSIFVDFVCASAEMLAATVFLGNDDDVASALLIVLIDER